MKSLPSMLREPVLILAALLLLAGGVVLRPSIRGNDGVQNYAYLHSVFFDADLDFTNNYRYYFERDARWFDFNEIPRDPVTRLPVNRYGVGSSLLWAPWTITFHFLGKTANTLGASIVLDGHSYLYEYAVGAGSCFYATVGLIIIFALIRRIRGTDSALWSVLAIWLATPLTFYMYLHPSMSHANSFFLTSLLFYLYFTRDGKMAWLLMGMTWSLVTMTRFQDGAFGVAIAVGEILRWGFKEKQSGSQTSGPWLEKPADDPDDDDHSAANSNSTASASSFGTFAAARLIRYSLFVLAAAVTLVPQFIAWHILQGTAFSGPKVYWDNGTFDILSPRFAPNVLFSSFHGLFFWHPILLIAFWGLLRPGNSALVKLLCLTGFMTQVWIVSCWSVWWAGASFGHRMFISSLPLLAVGLTHAIPASGRMRAVLKIGILSLICWNFGNIVQYGSGMIARQGPVPFTTLLYNNVIEVPKVLMGVRPIDVNESR